MCGECPQRERCIQPCAKLLKELNAVTTSRSGREILLPLHRFTYLYTSRSSFSLASIQRPEIKPPKFRSMMSLLTVSQREVLHKKYVRMMSERQIARELGISKGAVHFRLVQAREKVKKYLKFYYPLCEG